VSSLSDGQKAAVGLVVLLLIYGVLVFGVLPRHVFFSGDEGMKFALSASVARQGNAWRLAYEYPGKDIDPEYRFFPFNWMWVRRGRPAPVYLWAMIFVNAPLYKALGIDGLYILPLLCGVGVAWLSYKVAQMMGSPRPWVVVPLTGLCTPLFFYSLVAWDHTQVVLLTMVAVYLLSRQAFRHRRWEVVVAGVAAGFGLWTRYEMFLVVPVLAFSYVYVLRGERGVWRDVIAFAAGVGLVLLGMMAQQWEVYATLQLGAIGARMSTIELAQEGATSTLETLRNQLLHQAEVIFALTFDGSAVWLERVLVAVAFVGVIFVHRFARLRGNPFLVVASALLLLAGVLLAFLHPRLPAPPTGLIITLPLSALGLVYLPQAHHERQCGRQVYDLLMTVNVLFLFLGIFTIPYIPGYSWGPRYLAPAFPLLVILAWTTMNRAIGEHSRPVERRAICVTFVLLSVVSLAVQCVGTSQLYEKKAKMRDWYDGTLALGVDYVLSDNENYLQEMAGLYFQKGFFRVQDQREYTDLVSVLYREEIHRYAFMQSTHSEIVPLIETEEFRVVETGRVYEIVRLGELGQP
jgi:hypothetical protein